MTDLKQPQLRSTAWLAELLGVTVSCIEKRRSQAPNTLPPHIKIGRMVRYIVDDVYTWLEAQRSVNRHV